MTTKTKAAGRGTRAAFKAAHGANNIERRASPQGLLNQDQIATLQTEARDHLGLATVLSRAMLELGDHSMKRNAGRQILLEWRRSCWYAGIAIMAGAR